MTGRIIAVSFQENRPLVSEARKSYQLLQSRVHSAHSVRRIGHGVIAHCSLLIYHLIIVQLKPLTNSQE